MKTSWPASRNAYMTALGTQWSAKNFKLIRLLLQILLAHEHNLGKQQFAPY
jgi:hypothetical protein